MGNRFCREVLSQSMNAKATTTFIRGEWMKFFSVKIMVHPSSLNYLNQLEHESAPRLRLFSILGMLTSLLLAKSCHLEELVQGSISLWSFPLWSETELTAPSLSFPEHSAHPSSISSTMLYDSSLHSLSSHSSLIHHLNFLSQIPNTDWTLAGLY